MNCDTKDIQMNFKSNGRNESTSRNCISSTSNNSSSRNNNSDNSSSSKTSKRNKTLRLFSALLTFNILIISFFTTPSSALSVQQTSHMRLAMGDNHALLIDAEGNVWAYGENSNGQIGDGTTITRTTPIMVYSKGMKGRAIAVAAGSKQSLALLEDGTVLSWGFGNSVQDSLKNPEIQKGATSVSAGQETCMAILSSGGAVIWSDKSSQLPVKNSSGVVLTDVTEIAVGSNSFLILRAGSEGSVYQLTLGSNEWVAEKVVMSPISTSPSPSSSTSVSSSSPSPSPTITISATNYLNEIKSISAGNGFGIALKATGEVYSWGSDLSCGALGQGTYNTTNAKAKKINDLSDVGKISAGKEHSIVITNSGNVYGWGKSLNDRLDYTTSSSTQTKPVSLNISINAMSQYDCGYLSNIALNSQGEFYSWGDSKDVSKLELKQSLLENPNPVIAASPIGDQSMTLSWNPDDFFTEMSVGFMITYSMPDGTVKKTQLLPITQRQITLLGLQAATNYSIALSVIGKTGFEDKAPAIIVQTAVDDGVVPSPEPTVTPSPLVDSSDDSNASSMDFAGTSDGKWKIPSLLNLLLIILVSIILIGAVVAIIFVWKKLDTEEPQKIKPVHISPIDTKQVDDMEEDDQGRIIFDKNAAVPTELAGRVIWNEDLDDEIEDNDMKIVTGKETTAPLTETITKKPATFIYPSDESDLTEEDKSLTNNSSNYDQYANKNNGTDNNANDNNANDYSISNSITSDSIISNNSYTNDINDSNINTFDSNASDNNSAYVANNSTDINDSDIDEGFLSRLKLHSIDEDDDDDFIIRKPGEPKK